MEAVVTYSLLVITYNWILQILIKTSYIVNLNLFIFRSFDSLTVVLVLEVVKPSYLCNFIGTDVVELWIWIRKYFTRFWLRPTYLNSVHKYLEFALGCVEYWRSGNVCSSYRNPDTETWRILWIPWKHDRPSLFCWLVPTDLPHGMFYHSKLTSKNLSPIMLKFHNVS